MKVLISDKVDTGCVGILQQGGLEVDVNTGLSVEELLDIIGGYAGLIVRSATKVTEAVIERAEQVLASLEEGNQSSALTRLADDLPLFSAITNQNGAGTVAESSPLAEALSEIDADGLTPKEALELIYRLKGMLDH